MCKNIEILTLGLLLHLIFASDDQSLNIIQKTVYTITIHIGPRNFAQADISQP